MSHGPARGSAVLDPPLSSSVITTHMQAAVLSRLDCLTVSYPPLMALTVSFLSRSQNNFFKKNKNRMICIDHQNPLLTSSFYLEIYSKTPHHSPLASAWSDPCPPFQASLRLTLPFSLHSTCTGCPRFQAHTGHPASGTCFSFWLRCTSLHCSSDSRWFSAEASLRQSPVHWPRQCRALHMNTNSGAHLPQHNCVTWAHSSSVSSSVKWG